VSPYTTRCRLLADRDPASAARGLAAARTHGMTSVFGSMLSESWLLLNSSNRMPWSRGARRTGASSTSALRISLMAPARHFRIEDARRSCACDGEEEPARLEGTPIVCGSLSLLSGILYSVTFPVFASPIPMTRAALPVYQICRSPSGCRPCGPELGVPGPRKRQLPLNCWVREGRSGERPMVTRPFRGVPDSIRRALPRDRGAGRPACSGSSSRRT